MTGTIGVAAAVLTVGWEGAAKGAILALDGTGVVNGTFLQLGGGDTYPFAGVGMGAPIGFHFEYDTDATPVSFSGDVAFYELDGGGSFMSLDGQAFGIDSMVVTVGTNWGGTGTLGFYVRNETIGLTAGVYFLSDDAQAWTLPTTMAGYDTANGSMLVNSDLNLATVPLVSGITTAAAVTPTPGGLAALGAGALLVGRRRR